MTITLATSTPVEITAAPSTGGLSTESAAGGVTQPTSGPPEDGVFTEAQAERGALIYRRSCRKCHYADLLGDSGTDGTPGEVAPALAGPDFAARWQGGTLGEMFQAISRAMPHDRPGTLKADAVADVISYVLKMNGFPAGDTELPPDEAELQKIPLTVTP